MTQTSETASPPSARDAPAVPPRGNPISPLVLAAVVVLALVLGARDNRRRRRG